MQDQNYQNHTQRVPGFNILGLVLAATFIGACVNLYQSWGDHQRLYSASLILVLTGCILTAAFYSRIFALRAQDRAIRAEENLRHYVLAGKLLDPKLTIGQVIALRFASDAEFVELARKAAADNMPPDEIKRAIRSWRADYHRV